MSASHCARVALAGGVLLAGVSRVAFADSAARQALPPLSYIALGDSSGVGVGARDGGYVAHLYSELSALRPGSRLLNLCGSGATTARVLSQQVPRVPRDGGVVTLGVGVNDLHRRVSADEFGDRLEAIVRGVRARTLAPIVVTNLPDVSLAPIVPAYLRALVAYQVRAYNDIIARVAARHRLTLVDAYTPSRRELPDHPEFFSDDGFHPSDAGYRFWAGVIWPELRATLPEAASAPGG
jgi:acyl-CoA thioesterase I